MAAIDAYVDRIYCINLDSRKDRWQNVSDEFARIGILDRVDRVPGIVDRDPRIGCLKSHQACVNDAGENGYEKILVCEDDVRFYDIATSAVAGAVEFLTVNETWELFYLGGMVMTPARFLAGHVFKACFFSTHAYIIHQRAYEKVRAAEAPIDIWYAGNMYSCGLYPLYATQSESYSDIRKKVIVNREDGFLRKYRLLVEPPFPVRWKHYLYRKYLRNIYPFRR